jgi:LmbE family N-acetylglucosaminyl deacetylase
MSNALSNTQQPVMLVVLAHPDDETFGMGGTLAYYALRGVYVHLICATRGEVGEMDERYLRGFNSIADRRVAELKCAAEKLGLKEVHFLNYRDSGMAGSLENQHPEALAFQPVEKVTADVIHYIRQIKPQVVITFDPIGGYRHPDHIAIHNATVKAFYEAGKSGYPDNLPPYQPQKLYFQTFPHRTLRLMVRLMPLIGKDPRHVGKNKDIDLVSISEVSFPINAVVHYRSVAEVRDEASACHASQGGQEMSRGPFGWLRRIFGARETFMRAFPEPNPRKKEYDLFSGVEFEQAA